MSSEMSPSRRRLPHPADPCIRLSVVVPCLNEQEVICSTHQRLTAALEQAALEFEIIYVDDGSTDATPSLLRELQAQDARVRVVRFSRNFGHQVAITAGLEHASGDAVAIIDADLQDPPEVILEFLQKWMDGYDVAYGMRTERDGEPGYRLFVTKIFYRLLSRLSETPIPLDTGDFRLMDRRVVEELLSMPERDRFVRGMVSWLGFSQVAVPFHRAARAAGKPKYSLLKLFRLAADGIFSFSVSPLRLAVWTGFCASGLAILAMAFAFFERIFGMVLVKGWTSTMIAILFMGGVQLICLGIIGEYVGRIYGESKRRPLYVIRESIGFRRDGSAAALDVRGRAAVAGR